MYDFFGNLGKPTLFFNLGDVMFEPELVFIFWAVIGGLLLVVLALFIDLIRTRWLYYKAWKQYTWSICTQRSILIQILDLIIVDLQAIEVGDALQKVQGLRDACLTAEKNDPNLQRHEDENKATKPGSFGY